MTNDRTTTLPKTGAVCAQWKRCGKPACRCANGAPHGPYYCLFWREGGRLRKRYVRLADAPAAQAARGPARAGAAGAPGAAGRSRGMARDQRPSQGGRTPWMR